MLQFGKKIEPTYNLKKKTKEEVISKMDEKKKEWYKAPQDFSIENQATGELRAILSHSRPGLF